MAQQVALVIGASSSIGDEIVSAFLSRGEKVIASYNATQPSINHPNLSYEQLDVTSQHSRETFIAKSQAGGLKFNTVIMLPSIIFGLALHDYSDQNIDMILDVNFTAQAKFMRDLLPLMHQASRLILMGSIASERGSFDPLYAASKGALIPFAKSLARAYGEKFSTLALLPGPIKDSTMYDEMNAETQARHKAQNPRSHLLAPADLAQIILDISSAHWQHANGAIIRLNGGAYV